MGKYAPIKEFLLKQERDHVPMTFEELEEVLGVRLPPSKKYPAWWSNNPSNNPMTREWLSAGYETESVNVQAGKLTFRRVRKVPPQASHEVDEQLVVPSRGEHPIFGCMEGSLTLLPDVDLTEPADPEWGRVYGDR